MADPFIGEIRIFAGNFAPAGWAFCDGQQLMIQQNTALFAVIGNAFGGDGRTNFNLPDLRGRAGLGYGNGPNLTPRPIAQKGGAATVHLTSDNLPAHTHVPNCQTATDSSSPNGTIWANPGGRTPAKIYNSLPGIGMNINALKATGGTDAHNNVQPNLGLNFIIALQGIFPPRS
jgi:microcystin-dependent protein